MKEGVYEFKLIAYPSKAPLPEVKHKGETYVVSTPGQEYQAVVQLPARGGGGYWGGGGGSKGYIVELDIDGKPVGYNMIVRQAGGTATFQGFAIDTSYSQYDTFKFSETSITKGGGGGAGAGAGAGAGSKALGTLACRVFHARRGQASGGIGGGANRLNNHRAAGTVKKGGKFFMKPSMSTQTGSRTGSGIGRAAYQWTKESQRPVATLKLSYEQAETLQLRGAKVNMALFFDEDDGAGAGGAGAGGAAEVKPEPVQWAQPKSVRRAEKKRKAEEAAAAARKKAKQEAVKAEKQEPADDSDSDDDGGVIDLTA